MARPPKAPEALEEMNTKKEQAKQSLEDFLNPDKEESIPLSSGVVVRVRRPSISNPLVDESYKAMLEVDKAFAKKGLEGMDEKAILLTRATVTSIRACAVVDADQREYTEDEWVQILGASDSMADNNPLIKRCRNLVVEAIRGTAKVDPT